MPNASVLSLNDVTVAYDSVTAVEGVTFEVRNGEFFCIVGANGSGKSSLIKGILGLLPLVRGEVVFGIDRERVSYVPQLDTGERDFPATVREVVLTGTQRKGRRIPFYTDSDRASALDAMKLFDIDTLARRQIGELSGGQQQRVMLARAMCRHPGLLFLDEPCAGLDAEAKDYFYTALRRLNTGRSLTVVMVSHDLADVESCADRVAVLASRLIFWGDVEEWRSGAANFKGGLDIE